MKKGKLLFRWSKEIHSGYDKSRIGGRGRMRRELFLSLSFLLILSSIAATPISAGDDYPYMLRNYQPLNIADGYKSCISPDGTQVAFLSNAEETDNRSIWVANIDGTDMRMVYRNSSIDSSFTGPKFSPDSEKIVFTLRIYNFSIPKGEEGRLTLQLAILAKNGAEWNYTEPAIIYSCSDNSIQHLSFSPDGNRIVYFSPEGGGYGDVWTIDLDGDNRTRLTFDHSGGFNPSFSPDGKKIVYLRYSDEGNHELWIGNADGTNQRRLLKDSWFPDTPMFMPDGKIILQAGRISPRSNEIGAGYIWMMDQDGSNRTLLIPSYYDGISYNFYPSISSDGTKIVVDHGIRGDLYVIEDPDGDGEWEDSDGDGVADICDRYPNDPDRGYYKDDDFLIIQSLQYFFVLCIAPLLVLGLTGIVCRRAWRKKRGRKLVEYLPAVPPVPPRQPCMPPDSTAPPLPLRQPPNQPPPS